MELTVKNFLKISVSLLVLIILMFTAADFFIYYLSVKYYTQFALTLMIMLIIILAVGVVSMGLVVRTYKVKYVPKVFNGYVSGFMSAIYPFLHIIAKIAKLDTMQLRAFFIEINNILVSSKNYKVDPSKVLILTPHCLQDSESKIKITNNARNCKRCGKCNIKDLLNISEKYGTSFYVASGGTFARKVVSEIKPKFIVSVACERDLLSGIQDVKVPVIGVVNERPNGPCFNTKVDVEKLEDAVKKIILPEEAND
jgi:hypothetical protein